MTLNDELECFNWESVEATIGLQYGVSFRKKIALTEVNKNVDLQQTNSNDSEFNMWSADVTKVGQDIS